MRRLLLLSASALAAASAHAQTASPPDPSGAAAATAVSEVVVSAGRTPQAADTVGASVTVLTAPDLCADQETVLSDVLQRTPGVQVSRNGGPGGVTSLRIRGAESDQTLVLLDGVKLNDPSATGGGYNFADLLVGDVSRVEVLRGPQSVLYGSQAMGGVVNVVTAAPTQALEGDAQLEAGSYGTGYAKAAVGGARGPLTFRLAGQAYTTDGVSAFDERLGGKEADGYRNAGLAGRLTYAFTPDVSADLRGYWVDAKAKFDGYDFSGPPDYGLADDGEFGRTREAVGYAGLNAGLFDGRLKNRFAFQYAGTQRENYDGSFGDVFKTTSFRGLTTRAEYQGDLLLAPGWNATFGVERERSAFTSSSPGFDLPGTPPSKAHVSIDSGYGRLQGEVVPGLTLAGGVRYDSHEQFGDHVTGQASAAWSLNGGATVLRASFGQGFKAPTLYQLYSPYGNPALRPETADGYDAGIEQRFWGGRASVTATGFLRDSSNLIGFATCTGLPICADRPFGYYFNTSKARAAGAEVSGLVRPLPALSVSANYTYTDTEDRSKGAATYGNELARRPKHLANLGADYVWPFGLSTGVAVRYAGASFDDAFNTLRLKGYTLVDLRASYPLPGGLELYGRIENLTDRAYETAYAYGSLGRAAYGGVRLTF